MEYVETSLMPLVRHLDMSPLNVCARCNVKNLCQPTGLSADELDRMEGLVVTRRKVKRGDTLFVERDRFTSLFAIRSGFLKIRVASSDGREHVTGFHMAGEVIGVDGMAQGQHICDAVALEDTEVCVMPFSGIESAAQEVPALQRHVYKLLSQEIVRARSVILLLGNTRADERMATFLLDVSQRLQARGFSASEFVLRMTREEIGRYLCLKIETVSRTFSKFAADGVLDIKHRHVRIDDLAALRNIVKPASRPVALPAIASPPLAKAFAKTGLPARLFRKTVAAPGHAVASAW